MNATNDNAVNNFIIDTVLISPIEKILKQLKNREFRDCDIKWLDSKMKNFIDFAAQTLKVNSPVLAQSEGFTIFNEYVAEYYTKRFTVLLEYFKSF